MSISVNYRGIRLIPFSMLKRQILGYFENPFYGHRNDVKVLWQWKIVVDLFFHNIGLKDSNVSFAATFLRKSCASDREKIRSSFITSIA